MKQNNETKDFQKGELVRIIGGIYAGKIGEIFDFMGKGEEIYFQVIVDENQIVFINQKFLSKNEKD